MKFVFPLVYMFAVTPIYAQVILPPYSSSFDNLPADTAGWTHYAISGTEDWEVGAPAGNYITVPYSIDNAWVTDLDTAAAPNSIRCLETPYFDLSDPAQQYLFTFRHRLLLPPFDSFFKIQYKSGSSPWMALPNTTFDENIDPLGMFDMNTPWSAYELVRYNMSGFSGALDSVKLRFYVSTVNVEPESEGWALDDFTIEIAERNIYTFNADTITGCNKYFSSFEIEYFRGLTNEINDGAVPLTHNFYFSEDPVFDPTDSLIGSGTGASGNFVTDNVVPLDETFNMPANLTQDYYYIFFVFDEANAVAESNETDNIGMAVLALEPVFETNYLTHFDSSATGWSKLNNTWKHGDPDSWNIEDAHSGKWAWSAI
jgi:hypothetical protein